MNWRSILRPEYLLRPRNIWRRLRQDRFTSNATTIAKIGATGLVIEVKPIEYLGKNVLTFGIYDLPLSETLISLVSPGQTVVDVGANIGYSSVLMADKVGKAGKVFSFEPVASLFHRLERNIQLNQLNDGRVELFNFALSDLAGSAQVELPENFELNEGIMSLEPRTYGSKKFLTLELQKIDDILSHKATIDLLKIDVEGHESAVLHGAQDFLDNHRISVIVFEEHGSYPTKATSILERAGYHLFRIDAGLFRLKLRNPAEYSRPSLEPNWLAVSPQHRDRVVQTLNHRHWTVL